MSSNKKKKKRIFRSMDMKQSAIDTQDAVISAAQQIAKNKQLVAVLGLIDKPKELSDLLTLIFKNLPNFQPSDIKAVLKQVVSRLKLAESTEDESGELKEEQEMPDLVRTQKILDAFSVLKTPLSQINTVEEVAQFILRVLLPVINTKLKTSRALIFSSIRAFLETYLNNNKEDKQLPKPQEERLSEIVGRRESFMLKNLLK